MLTPQEIKGIQFDKVMFGGYDMAAVDETLQEIASDYGTLVKENASLKSKLKVLATTIEEYRSVDEAMRKALVTAQNMANEMVREAHEKADEILKNASAVASAKVADLATQISAEEKHLAEAKAETAMFIDAMSKAYKIQSEKLDALRPDVKVAENSTALEDTLTLAANEISKCVESAIENMKAYEKRAKIDDLPPLAPEVEEIILKDERKEKTIEKVVKVEKKEPVVVEAPKKEKKYDLSAFDTVSDNVEDTLDLEQMSFDSQSKQLDKDDDDDDFGDLKFGRNYDFDEE